MGAKHHLQRHFSTAHPEKEWLIKEEFYKSNSADPTYDPKEEYDQEDFTEFCEPYLEEIEDDFIDYSASNEYSQNAKPPRPKIPKSEVKKVPKVHKCPHATCDKFFSKPSKAKRHHEQVHEGLRPFACTDCDMKYKTKKNLQRHQE